ncbi:unnamed protein product [Ixodes pacificus]
MTMRGSSWSLETLLSSGSRGYGVMRELGRPLPRVRTLQHHLESSKFRTRMLVNVMDSLAVKVYIPFTFGGVKNYVHVFIVLLTNVLYHADWSHGATRTPCYVDAGGDPADARTRVR